MITTILGVLLFALGLLFKPLYNALRGILGRSTDTNLPSQKNASEGLETRYTDPDEPKDNLHEIQKRIKENSPMSRDDLGHWLDNYFDRSGRK